MNYGLVSGEPRPSFLARATRASSRYLRALAVDVAVEVVVVGVRDGEEDPLEAVDEVGGGGGPAEGDGARRGAARDPQVGDGVRLHWDAHTRR